MFISILYMFRAAMCSSSGELFFFFQALNFLVESFGLLNDLFPLPFILDAGYPVFDLHLADVQENCINTISGICHSV
jgi:hypothetical protein